MDGINSRILEIIEKSGMKKVEVGRLCGVSGQHISGLCTGASAPSNAFIMAFCRAMDVDETWLRTGVGDPKPDNSLMEDVGRMIADVMADLPKGEQEEVTRALVRMGPAGWRNLIQFLVEFKKSIENEQKNQG